MSGDFSSRAVHYSEASERLSPGAGVTSAEAAVVPSESARD